ncbi:MAG TPA: TetR/AcrR family transcriptional regulator [Pseudonocardia sp.]|jgi:AcrR family transcriptional regulator
MPVRGRPRAFDRAEALQAAMRVFWEHGYEGASISALTTAMGINAPSLYAAFHCKEALFREAVGLYERCHGLAPADGVPVRDAVAGLLRAAAVAYTEPDQPRGCLVILAATSYTPKTESVRDHLGARRAAAATRVRERVSRAAETGELPDGIDLEVLTDYVITTIQGMSLRARDGVSRSALLAVADAAMAGWDSLTSREAERSGVTAER